MTERLKVCGFFFPLGRGGAFLFQLFFSISHRRDGVGGLLLDVYPHAHPPSPARAVISTRDRAVRFAAKLDL